MLWSVAYKGIIIILAITLPTCTITYGTLEVSDFSIIIVLMHLSLYCQPIECVVTASSHCSLFSVCVCVCVCVCVQHMFVHACPSYQQVSPNNEPVKLIYSIVDFSRRNFFKNFHKLIVVCENFTLEMFTKNIYH